MNEMAKKKQSNEEPKIQGVPNRKSLYARLSKYAPKAIKTTVELLDSPNDNVRLGAIKILLAKTMPDLRSTEITGKDGEQFPITIVTGLDATRTGFIPPPARSITNGQTPLQSTSVASKSKKDIDSNKRDSETSAP